MEMDVDPSRAVVKGCFYQLRQLRSVRRSLTVDARRAVVTAFVAGRILQRCFVECCKNHYPTATDSDERCRSTCKLLVDFAITLRRFYTRHASLAADPATN